MIAANGVTARFLARKASPAPPRRALAGALGPHRELAEELGERLPPDPEPKALEEFLVRRRKADPLRFPDLSLVGREAHGRRRVRRRDAGRGRRSAISASRSRTTRTRRRRTAAIPDLITQRLVKAALRGAAAVHARGAAQLARALHGAGRRGEQGRAAGAEVGGGLSPRRRIGERFDGIVTGASAKGTWVRIFHPPVEGKVVHGGEGLDVGDRVRVKLIDVDVAHGYIDFVRTGN